MSFFYLWSDILYIVAQVSEAVFRTCQIAALAFFFFNYRNQAKSENTNMYTYAQRMREEKALVKPIIILFCESLCSM